MLFKALYWNFINQDFNANLLLKTPQSEIVGFCVYKMGLINLK